jgi:hypothetical protein
VAAARRLGYPVALKIDSPDVPHKTDAGGVRLGLASDAAVREAWEGIMASVRAFAPAARIAGALVQEMVPAGVEVLVGVTADPQFGLQLAVGLGGVLVELLRAVAVRALPLSPRDARELTETPLLARLLDGFRGRPPADRAALVAAVLAVSDLASDLGDRVEEIDVNPLVVLPAGHGVRAVDALIVTRA